MLHPKPAASKIITSWSTHHCKISLICQGKSILPKVKNIEIYHIKVLKLMVFINNLSRLLAKSDQYFSFCIANFIIYIQKCFLTFFFASQFPTQGNLLNPFVKQNLIFSQNFGDLQKKNLIFNLRFLDFCL